MPSLPQSVVEQIRQAIKDYPTDFFLRLPVTYRLNTETPQRWAEEGSKDYTDYALETLHVEYNEKSDTVEEDNVGSFADAEGYLLFNFDDLDTAGLIENNLPIFNPNVDEVVFNNKTYDVRGVHPLGQLVDRYTLVKVNIRSKVKQLG